MKRLFLGIMRQKLIFIGLVLLALDLGSGQAEECVLSKTLEKVREDIGDEIQETSRQLLEMAILLERVESKIDKFEQRLSSISSHTKSGSSSPGGEDKSLFKYVLHFLFFFFI